jgi:Ala-tRNA(Pro) deacylase
MDICEFLGQQNITYERHDHAAVFTVADVKKLVPALPGAETKNLFLRDGPGKKHYLVIVPADKQVDLKNLAPKLGVKRVSFGSPDRLKKHLGIEPGAVSLFAVINDTSQKVSLFIDQDIWGSEAFQFHPLINTATVIISKPDVERFLDAVGHPPQIVDVPARD